MKRVIRRLVLSAAALSPGVAAVSVPEMALSFALMLLGVTGFIGVAAVAISMSPRISETLDAYDVPGTEYPSLLVASAFDFLQVHSPDPVTIRAQLHGFVKKDVAQTGRMAQGDQIALVLSRVMTRWGETDLRLLTDDQLRELWLIERILRAPPDEAGALANFFVAPNAVLAMRDQVAGTVSA